MIFANNQMRSYSHIRGLSKLCLAFLALTIAFFGCRSKDSPASTSGTWTITGKTALVGSVNPLSAVTIRCGGQSTTSGPDGSYELRGVPEGVQSLTAQGPECKPFSKSIDVRANMRYYIFLDRIGATLTGYVSNMLDGPIAGAKIAIGDLTDFTDAAGKFALSEVPLNPDSLTVSHPRYFTEKAAYLAEGPEAQFNILLQRDSVFTGNIVADSYVDESQPNPVGYSNLLLMSGSGTGTTRRHIYIEFEFPAFMRDTLAKLTGGSLDLCSIADASNAPFVPFRVYVVTSQWQWFSLSFSRQPTSGRQIASGTIARASTPQYWTILNTNAIAELLSDYRANGLIYGITIQGGASNFTKTFYSTRSLVNPPRLSFKVRF